MSSVMTSNTIAGRDNKAPAPELHEDGTNYPYRMFFGGGQHIVDADSPAECIEYLIPGYLYLTFDQKYDALNTYLNGVQQTLRANIAAAVTPGEVEDWEWKLLSGHYEDENGEVGDPWGWSDGSVEPYGEVDHDAIDIWSSKYPLVLKEVSYEPHTETPPPFSTDGDYKFVSNIIWLRSESELDFLRSLNYAGIITFGSPRAASEV